jgi:hypothetical protein
VILSDIISFSSSIGPYEEGSERSLMTGGGNSLVGSFTVYAFNYAAVI